MEITARSIQEHKTWYFYAIHNEIIDFFDVQKKAGYPLGRFHLDITGGIGVTVGRVHD